MKIRFISFFDYVICFASLILITIGIAFIYSAGVDFDGNVISKEYIKQIIFAVTGTVLMFCVAFLDFKKYSRYCVPLYIAINVTLLFTCLFGRVVNGAQSWLGIGGLGIQPSEFGKIIFILFLAWYLERSQRTNSLRRFLIALSILAIPMFLILLQPDLGTASVYIPIFIVMCFLAGIPLHLLLTMIGAVLLTILFTVIPVWASEIYRQPLRLIEVFTNINIRLVVIIASSVITILGLVGYFRFHTRFYLALFYIFAAVSFALLASIAAGKILKDYQLKRLIVFIAPESDPRGAGWNIIQSKIAIGSGGIHGKGFLKGTQSHYRFLPQHNTDFIFSILAEEWGLIGGIIVFGLYLIILVRIITIIKNTTHIYAANIAAGIFGMFFFHFIVNIGMVMGMMPITGIPLLFLSYGGSALWTAMICVGLLMGINARRLQFSPGE